MIGKLVVGDSRQILNHEDFIGLRGSIRLIYIDPPYNTRSQKSYRDDIAPEAWKQDMICALEALHCMLARNGAIFISIDDNEYANLKLICDDIFGKENFIGTFITRQAQRSNSRFINITHEYILCFARDKSALPSFAVRRMDIPEQRRIIVEISRRIGEVFTGDARAAEKALRNLVNQYCERHGISWLKNYNCVDSDGRIFFASDLSVPGKPRHVDIDEIDLHLAPLKSRSWASDAKFMELHEKGLLAFRKGRPYCKKFLLDACDNAPSVLNFYSRFGTKDLNKLGLRDLFDTPKPVELVKFLIRMMKLENGDCVLDCFAGSGTTGQAVIEINLEDKKEIDFMLIQRKEKVAENSGISVSCKKYGILPYISEIAKLRLQKVYEKYGMPDCLQIIEYEL